MKACALSKSCSRVTAELNRDDISLQDYQCNSKFTHN